ncbi:MAG TPA: hypothetical protein VKB78_11075, partial [Pirellulales bacterium]|nr:hypothetical protein [Pirellulales bacterium]
MTNEQEPIPSQAVSPAVEHNEADDQLIGTALRWSIVVMLLLAAIIGGGVYWFNRTVPPADKPVAKL